MRILWVKAGKLLPVDTGGKIRSYNLLRCLAARDEITLLSYYGGRRDPEYEAALEGAFPGAIAVVTGAPDGGGFARALDYLRRLPGGAPYAVSKFTSPAVRARIEAAVAERRPDVAVCDFLAASGNFPARLGVPCVLFQHNVETALWRRQARHESSPLLRTVFRFEAARMARYERATVGRFAHVVSVSDGDREMMLEMTDPSRIAVVPTGVDLDLYSPAPEPGGAAPLVVFTGSMDWQANIDGVEFFCREVWPRVEAAVPNARFRIVGRDPHPRVRRLEGGRVEVTGAVPSVIPHLREAAVVVVPLRIGGGTRLKIYEAMAMGKAVVSTSVGAEGLDVRHGETILLAEDPAAFARSVVTLLGDERLRRAYGTAAAALARRYGWPSVAERFAEVLRQAAGLPSVEAREASQVAAAPRG